MRASRKTEDRKTTHWHNGAGAPRSMVEDLKTGAKHWFDEAGLPHRDDGPAVEAANGDRFYFQNGKLHRLDGPAIEKVDGHREWRVMALIKKGEIPGIAPLDEPDRSSSGKSSGYEP